MPMSTPRLKGAPIKIAYAANVRRAAISALGITDGTASDAAATSRDRSNRLLDFTVHHHTSSRFHARPLSPH